MGKNRQGPQKSAQQRKPTAVTRRRGEKNGGAKPKRKTPGDQTDAILRHSLSPDTPHGVPGAGSGPNVSDDAPSTSATRPVASAGDPDNIQGILRQLTGVLARFSGDDRSEPPFEPPAITTKTKTIPRAHDISGSKMSEEEPGETSSQECYGRYLTPQVLLNRVPEQITDDNVWYQTLLLKQTSEWKLQCLHNVTRSYDK